MLNKPWRNLEAAQKQQLKKWAVWTKYTELLVKVKAVHNTYESNAKHFNARVSLWRIFYKNKIHQSAVVYLIK
jgi:hypothetical protein